MELNAQKWIDQGIEFVVNYGPKLIGAILIWIIGSWVIKKLMRATSKMMSLGNYDESLQKFLSNLLGWGLKILLILAVLDLRL